MMELKKQQQKETPTELTHTLCQFGCVFGGVCEWGIFLK